MIRKIILCLIPFFLFLVVLESAQAKDPWLDKTRVMLEEMENRQNRELEELKRQGEAGDKSSLRLYEILQRRKEEHKRLLEESREREQALDALRSEYSNPTKIKLGMSKSDVLKAWGEPYKSSRSISQNSSVEIWTYGSREYTGLVFLTFVNGKLVRITNP